jgi:hypothetical protein
VEIIIHLLQHYFVLFAECLFSLRSNGMEIMHLFWSIRACMKPNALFSAFQTLKKSVMTHEKFHLKYFSLTIIREFRIIADANRPHKKNISFSPSYAFN